MQMLIKRLSKQMSVAKFEAFISKLLLAVQYLQPCELLSLQPLLGSTERTEVHCFSES